MMLPAFARNSALTFFCAVLVFLFPGSPQPLARSSDDETAAVAPLRKAVELLPAESRPRYLLAVALDRSGDRAGAAQAFAALLDLDPNEVHALEYLGWTSLRSGKPAEAEVRFRRALEV